MLKQLYIDNYKCFVNFEITFDKVNLLLGKNGAGKTSLFDVPRKIKEFVLEEGKLKTLFPASSLTRWDKRPEQTFEITFAEKDQEYRYRLVIEHEITIREEKSRVREEKVFLNGQPLFSFELGKVQLYRDNGTLGPTYTFDWGGSAVATIGESPDNQRLMRFRKRLSCLYVLRPNPLAMPARSEKEDRTLEYEAANLASWYRYLNSQYPEKMGDLFQDLKEVFEGFRALKSVDQGGTSKILTLDLNTDLSAIGNAGASYVFDELSDGQRQLILLYTISRFSLMPETTTCIDEPDNFVSLREIQPWLMGVSDYCQENDAQVLLISHHPEIINQLAVENGLLLTRQSNGPVRVRPFSKVSPDGLTAAELIARGWDDE